MALPLAVIIEDDPEQIRFFQRTLETVGYEVSSVSNGAEALVFLKTVVPHLIMLDLHLPDVNGAGILAQIKDDVRLDKTMVIVASADGTFAGYMKERADFVLSKPVGFHQLQQLALRLLP